MNCLLLALVKQRPYFLVTDYSEIGGIPVQEGRVCALQTGASVSASNRPMHGASASLSCSTLARPGVTRC